MKVENFKIWVIEKKNITAHLVFSLHQNRLVNLPKEKHLSRVVDWEKID